MYLKLVAVGVLIDRCLFTFTEGTNASTPRPIVVVENKVQIAIAARANAIEVVFLAATPAA